MSAMTHAEACAALEVELQELGKTAARRIMGRTVADLLEPDEMTALVDEESDRFSEFFLSKGASAGDVEIALGIFKQAVIREGKRIAMGLGAEVGTA